jgi:putative ABC transport system substrate-binding protein
MRRRDFIKVVGGVAVTWPVDVRAQRGERMRRIGVLIGVEDDIEGQARLAAFRKGMLDLGWSEGRDLQMDVRFTAGNADRARIYAAELIKSAPDVILANTSTVVTALKERTTTIPIVFAQVVDPVNSGFVDSLAHPGGNITGFVSLDFGIGAKWLEILKQIAPRVTRVGVLRDATIPGGTGIMGAIQAATSSFKVELKALDVRDAVTVERGLSTFAREPNGGLIVPTSPAASIHHELIVRLAARFRIPAIYPYRFFVKSGGLLSYGIDNLDLWQKAASYVDRILKGANPAELPVQEPSKFELVINLKTANALGLTVPQSLLARADEVIEWNAASSLRCSAARQRRGRSRRGRSRGTGGKSLSGWVVQMMPRDFGWPQHSARLSRHSAGSTAAMSGSTIVG